MNLTNNLFKTTTFAALGAGLGYASALALPVVNPVAGAINGCFLGLAINLTGKNFSELENKELSIKDRMIHAALVTISLVASAALSFLVCLSLHIPVTFAACVVFPVVMGMVCVLVFLPIHAGSKLAELACNT
ncbi:MAG: hypothetical protein ACK4HV_03190, partial [Parachlamydiaceae bacterium]